MSHNGSSANGKHRVVIVGGGFAGLGCAQRLADHEDVEVTLIDRNNYHQFQPLLYQVATSQLAPSDIAHSLRGVFAGPAQRRRQARGDHRRGHGNADRDHAATERHGAGTCWSLAAGSQPNFFHTPGAAENSFPLYSLDDATRLRSRILGLFEHVDREPGARAARRAQHRHRGRGSRPALRSPARWATWSRSPSPANTATSMPPRLTSTCWTTATRC